MKLLLPEYFIVCSVIVLCIGESLLVVPCAFAFLICGVEEELMEHAVRGAELEAVCQVQTGEVIVTAPIGVAGAAVLGILVPPLGRDLEEVGPGATLLLPHSL